MCGFAGMINLEGLAGSRESRRAALAAMGAQLARRGPDDEQFYDDGLLSLVFRRLSIIDLDGGQQPLWNEDHSILTVVNGEIFNHQDIRHNLEDRHRFSSQSDSEVVVHLYEDQQLGMLDELNGMYALLVWDTNNRTFLLARDRLGIKPLFYARVPGGLLFGSELKALLAHPDCPRDIEWGDFESGWGFDNALHTFVRGVHQLPGGQALSLTASSQPRLSTYWSVRDFIPGPGDVPVNGKGHLSPEQYSQRYGELLQDSVSRQLMSDVPLGLFLSGGIDSSLLAAMAASAGQELHCFTVVEEGTLESGDVDQSVNLARHFGFQHYPVHYNTPNVLQQLKFDLESFEFLVWAVEKPAFNVEWLLKLELHRYAKTVLPGLKVILLGQGADEFAGGYSHSMGTASPDWEQYSRKVQGNHRAMKRIDMNIPAYLRHAMSDEYPPLSGQEIPSDFHREMVFRAGLLMRYNLWHEDRTSSSQGVEARVPFLDHRLVELLAGIPPELHARLFFDKHIIREQLAKAAPFYPPDKQKVRFYNTGKNDSTRMLRMDVVQRVYPGFRDKYLGKPSSIFSQDKLDTHFRFLREQARPANRDIKELLECMAIEVFAGQCRSMAQAAPPPACERGSPLQAWVGDAAAPQKKTPVDSWSMEL